MPPAVTVQDEIQIQRQSHGIKPDLYAKGWHTCYFSDNDINARDEEYYFPCSNDKQCCGRECCSPVTGFPIWLAWLIGLLLFLLLLLLTLCFIYFCWKYCCKTKRAAPPSPKPPPVVVHRTPGVQTYRRVPSDRELILRRMSDSNLIEIKDGYPRAYTPSNTSTRTTVVSVTSSNGYGSSTSGDHRTRRGRSHRRRRRDWSDDDDMHDDDDLDFARVHAREPPFVPSPMRESYESTPTPIHISYHDESEITQERRPLIGRVQAPEEQRAKSVYYRPGSDHVASYNELPK